jgi:hypothetical protein
MEETPKELTMKELLELVQRQEGEFIIRIEPGGEETNANADAGTGTL